MTQGAATGGPPNAVPPNIVERWAARATAWAEQWMPDAFVFALAATRQDILLIQTRTGLEVATLSPPVRANLLGLVFSSDGRYLAAHTMVWAVHLWDLQALRRELAAMNLDW